MDQEKKEKIAVFRFGVIGQMTGLKDTERGLKETILKDITSRQWDIPFSGRSYISRSTVLKWLRKYENSRGSSMWTMAPTFRSYYLQHITASLGIALLHCTPYRPEGKGYEESAVM